MRWKRRRWKIINENNINNNNFIPLNQNENDYDNIFQNHNNNNFNSENNFNEIYNNYDNNIFNPPIEQMQNLNTTKRKSFIFNIWKRKKSSN